MEMIVSVTSRSYSQWEGNITEMLSWLNILLSARRSWFGLLSYHIEKNSICADFVRGVGNLPYEIGIMCYYICICFPQHFNFVSVLI